MAFIPRRLICSDRRALTLVIASAAKQSRAVYATLDCFAALAMTNGVKLVTPPQPPGETPWAASRSATFGNALARIVPYIESRRISRE